MVYLFRYHQNKKDEITYRRICRVLDDSGYLHEVCPGEVLIAPTCHIHHLRLRLAPLIGEKDRMVISPVLFNQYKDAAARQFVDFWINTSDHSPPYSVAELIAQADA